LELAEEKHAAKTAKEVEKARKAEEKRIQKEEKRKSKAQEPEEDAPKTDLEKADGEVAAAISDPTTIPDTTVAAAEVVDKPDDIAAKDEPIVTKDTAPTETAMEPSLSKPTISTALPDKKDDSPSSPDEPTSPSKADSKGFKNFLNKFKRRSRHEPGSFSVTSPKKPGFLGGHHLTGSKGTEGAEEHPKSSKRLEKSAISAPIPINAEASGAADGGGGAQYSPSISSLSGDEDEQERGRSKRRISGIDDEDEARDAFDEKLAPPPKFSAASEAGSAGSPVRNTHFREEL
jgi:hypothetical protein